jgi:hypothetical protein
MADATQAIREPVVAKQEGGFVRAIGLFDGTMIVVGSMIGSGIFIVAAGIARQTGSPGGLLLTCFPAPAANMFIYGKRIRPFGVSFTVGRCSW